MVIIRRGPASSTSTRVQEQFRPALGAQAVCVVINGAPAQRDGIEKSHRHHRAQTADEIPRAGLGRPDHQRADLLMALSHGEGAREYYAEGRAAAEITGCGPRSNVRQAIRGSHRLEVRCTGRRRNNALLVGLQ